MNKKLRYLLLLVLPILLFISARLLKVSQGPYYLNFADPSYVYLVNSLNVSLGYPVGHYDHPGTTVQVIGAAVIRFYHMVSNPDADLIVDVLSRPEEYLNRVNVVLIFISSIVLFLLGLLTYKVSKSIALSLLIQLSPFVSTQIFYGYKIVASDNFLITAILCLIGILIYYLFKVNENKDLPVKFIFAFAVICGMGIATKISFLPLILIPLIIIKGFKNKIIFLSFLIGSFLFFVFPAISNYKNFIMWVWNLFIHSGSYGSGNATIVDFPTFFQSIKLIFQLDPFLAVSYFLSVISLAVIFFTKRKNDDSSDEQKKEIKLLLSIVIATTVQVIIVAKQYRQHYMIPSLVLSVLSISLSIHLLSYYFQKLKIQYVYSGMIIIIAAASFYEIFYSYKTCLILKAEAYKVNQYVKDNNSNALVIPSFGSASKEFALAYGVSYAGRKINLYKSVLSEIQKENIFYLPWYEEFFSLTSKKNMRNILQNSKKIIFQTNQNNVDKFVNTLRNTYKIESVSQNLLFYNKINEAVYEITTKNLSEEIK